MSPGSAPPIGSSGGLFVEVFYDLVCPWCFIGKRRFQRAIEAHTDVTIAWRPYLLNPGMPASGMDQRNYMTLKFGGIKRALQAQELISRTAERDGLHLDLDGIKRTPPTLDAHRFVAFAATSGIDPGLAVDSVFSAHFQQGLDIADPTVLAMLGALIGMDGQSVTTFLATDDGADAVRNSDWSGRRIGIQAVPCFVFGGRFALSGAQEPESFLPLLDLAALPDHRDLSGDAGTSY